MKHLFFSMIFMFSLLLIGCGENSQPSNKTNSSNSVNTKTNENANSASSNSQATKPVKIEIPVGKPLENGNTQTFKYITFTVPKDWKKSNSASNEFLVTFASSDNEKEAIKLSVMLFERERVNLRPDGSKATTIEDNLADYKNVASPGIEHSVLEINGVKGILMTQEAGQITWMSFPTKDSKNKSKNVDILFLIPMDIFEKNKQTIADILYSIKINN